MSDVPETPDVGAAEAAQGAVEQQQVEAPATERPAMPDGWTGEFDPHRAKATIERLREFERQVNTLSSDPDAAARFLAEKHGFEFADDEPDYDPQDDALPEEDDPVAAKVAELEQYVQQQQIEQATKAINDHIAELAGADGVKLTDRDKQIIFAEAVSGQQVSPEQTEKAFKEHVAWLKQRDEQVLEAYRQSKRAPAPPPAGQEGEPKHDPWDSEARVARIAARLTAEEA